MSIRERVVDYSKGDNLSKFWKLFKRRNNTKNRVLKQILTFRCSRLAHKHGGYIGNGAEIMGIPSLPHGLHGIYISRYASVGSGCRIYQNVTIGEINHKAPRIGDNCFIGAGAIIIGDIIIGNDVKIGAGALVTDSVADGCTVVSKPAEVFDKNKDNEEKKTDDDDLDSVKNIRKRNRWLGENVRSKDRSFLNYMKGRCWIELDREALRFNVNELKKALPDNCSLMPAVKAEAYGHGGVMMAKELNRMGIKSFCVASAAEGAQLRRNGIIGEILVLGYTHPEDFYLLTEYNLIQTVVDYAYAEVLNGYGRKISVHIGVDTGMHRLGERCENRVDLCNIYRMDNLYVAGLFTHLSADDTTEPKDREFTKKQADSFYGVIRFLKSRGLPCPKVHLLASYGLVNYPELAGDYARIGIALYGVLSTKKDTENCRIPLRPVLSFKVRIAAVREVYCGENVGYGTEFVAQRDMKTATLAIGYADGLPRSLSNGVGSVIIKGKKAPVAGLICMDQTIVDITDIPDVKSGDVAVVIGRDGDEEITACDLAEQAGTITNEILSRMGSRPERIWAEESEEKE